MLGKYVRDEGTLSMPEAIHKMTGMPAARLGLSDRGHLKKGQKADLVLFDPHERWIMGRETLHMAADWSAYQGIEITGRILRVLSRGELIISVKPASTVLFVREK